MTVPYISAPVSSYRLHKENLGTMHELRSTGENPIAASETYEISMMSDAEIEQVQLQEITEHNCQELDCNSLETKEENDTERMREEVDTMFALNFGRAFDEVIRYTKKQKRQARNANRNVMTSIQSFQRQLRTKERRIVELERSFMRCRDQNNVMEEELKKIFMLTAMKSPSETEFEKFSWTQKIQLVYNAVKESIEDRDRISILTSQFIKDIDNNSAVTRTMRIRYKAIFAKIIEPADDSD